MFDPYIVIVGASILIGLSYVYNIASSKFKVPSVLFLIGTGIAIKELAKANEMEVPASFFSILELLGIIGLIMIVLEAAVDLKLTKDKYPIVKRSIFLAIIVLIISSVSIALIIMYMRNEPFFNSLVYAIPLSVVSSAVVIPSIHTLTQSKREFLIYEATFSDIIGIMFFNFVVIQEGSIFSASGLIMLVSTVILSIFISYFLVWTFSKITTEIKLFLMIAFLALLYSIGKMFHLSSLLMIFIFGIVLNNSELFFFGRLKNYLNFDIIKSVSKDFRVVTGETAFVVRTFFFVAFGMSINLAVLTDFRVLSVGTLIVIALYLVRYINFKIFVKTDVFPEIFLAPRGLITILLFYSIPLKFQIHDFSVGILFYVILATSIIMMFALFKSPTAEVNEMSIIDIGSNPGVDLFNTQPSGPYCDIEENDNNKKNMSGD